MEAAAYAEAELFRLIAEYTYDWETWVDADGRARWVNAAVERITGRSAAECLADPGYPLALVHEADRAIAAQALAAAARGRSGNDVEFRVQSAAGHTRWVAMSWQPVRGERGEDLGYRTSIRDIDARKCMEHELHAMRRRAERALCARSALLANVSHELRSPVHCIAGFAELLAQQPLDAEQSRYVALIHDQCQSMLHQVEDLLGVAALEADGVGLKRGPFDVRQLVSRIVEGCEPRTRGRPVDLSVQAELAQPFRVGDSMRIRQVIRNLLDNALKFTDHGAVRVRVYAGNGELLCVEVADSGPGMAAHDVARMFEPFVQGDDATTRRHGGVGLGLAIVQRLVRAMEGELHVDSALGRGTTITLRLPLPFAEASVSEPPRALDGGSYPAHVLVVDDSAPARELLSAMLRRHGASATCAATGEEAKRMLAAGNFDLVLLDYQMPGADGAETGIALRRMLDARTEGRTVPIYLLTANVFARDALKKAGHAFAGILDKPLGQADLLRLLRGLGPPAGRGPEAEPPLLDAAVVADLRSTVARDGRSMLERFVPRVLGELQAELTPLMGEAAQPADHAHTLHALAGNALSIGARALGALLRTAEARARAGDAAGTRAALARAPQLLADTRAALDAR